MTNPLTAVEWETCRMAVRYSMNGATIATATLPALLVEAYWHRWTDVQKKALLRDLKKNLADQGENAFGDPTIDRPVWLKFMAALDMKSHYVLSSDVLGEHTVFEANGRVYPLAQYVLYPSSEIYIDTGFFEKCTRK